MYDLIVPISEQDFDVAEKNLPLIRRNLPVDKIILIGPSSISEHFTPEKSFSFIPEDSLLEGLNFNRVKELLVSGGGNPKRTGWYLQQFLKMAYAYRCEKDAYIIWDCDTIPVRPLSLQSEDGTYYIALKKEYNPAYFDTLHTLLGIEKNNAESYIAEHMIVDTKIMRELLHKITQNSSIPGEYFFDKIINAVPSDALSGAGFSEFETYGTYLTTYYPRSCTLRHLKTLRGGKKFFGSALLNEQLLDRLGKTYDTVSYEKAHIPYSFAKLELWEKCRFLPLNCYIFLGKISAKLTHQS